MPPKRVTLCSRPCQSSCATSRSRSEYRLVATTKGCSTASAVSSLRHRGPFHHPGATRRLHRVREHVGGVEVDGAAVGHGRASRIAGIPRAAPEPVDSGREPTEDRRRSVEDRRDRFGHEIGAVRHAYGHPPARRAVDVDDEVAEPGLADEPSETAALANPDHEWVREVEYRPLEVVVRRLVPCDPRRPTRGGQERGRVRELDPERSAERSPEPAAPQVVAHEAVEGVDLERAHFVVARNPLERPDQALDIGSSRHRAGVEPDQDPELTWSEACERGADGVAVPDGELHRFTEHRSGFGCHLHALIVTSSLHHAVARLSLDVDETVTLADETGRTAKPPQPRGTACSAVFPSTTSCRVRPSVPASSAYSSVSSPTCPRPSRSHLVACSRARAVSAPSSSSYWKATWTSSAMTSCS